MAVIGQDIFLARTEEQSQFRRSLTTLLPTTLPWVQRYLPTLGKLATRPQAAPAPEPTLLLFHGPGGMGKTTLTKRLHDIARTDLRFQGRVNTLFLDWEEAQKLDLELKVGHDNIEPETVLRVLHQALVNTGGGSCFGAYTQTLKDLDKAEEKVHRAMQGQPDSSLPDQVSKLGAKGLAYVIRMHPGTSALPQEELEAALDTTIKVSAEGLYQCRQFVQRSLTPKEYSLYEQPRDRLAAALGQGLTTLSQGKPLVVLFDTYEIVDRPDCDYTMRQVMQTSGDRVLWAIAGRSDLATSGQRGRRYFRGYQRDFAEAKLYTKALSEFGLDQIQQYFAQVAPDRPIADAEADAVARFSLGIPFVIRQTAVMWREGKPMAEIVAPVAAPLGSSAYDEVVRETSQRFLVHCFGAPEQAADLEAIYALALMRRPDADLLRQMLDEPDLETRLQRLKERYAFIWVEQLRLDEKLAKFLRAYLRVALRRTSAQVQTLNDRALAWLELQAEAQAQGIADTAEKLGETKLAETWLDLAHHSFWRGEEAGMRYLVPRFVEGWQYDRSWAKSLLELKEPLQGTLSSDAQKRLERMEAGLGRFAEPEAVAALLADLDKLKQRGLIAGPQEPEQETILLLQKGNLAFRLEHYSEALETYLTAEKNLPNSCAQLRKDLGQGFYQVSGKFIWPGDAADAVYSAEGEQAIEHALALNQDESDYWYRLAAICYRSNKLEEAIEACEQAITLDDTDAYSHNGLGMVYCAQGRYEEAITAYNRAITLDKTYIGSYHNLGEICLLRGKLDEAESYFFAFLDIAGEKFHHPFFGLGLVKALQGQRPEAVGFWQKSLDSIAGNSSQEKLDRSLIQFAMQPSPETIADLQQTLEDVKESKGYIRETLESAQLLARCPVPPQGLEQIVAMLQAALG